MNQEYHFLQILSSFKALAKFSKRKSLFTKTKILCKTRGQGIEPRLTGPKPAVLPLDDPRVLYRIDKFIKPVPTDPA